MYGVPHKTQRGKKIPQPFALRGQTLGGGYTVTALTETPQIEISGVRLCGNLVSIRGVKV